MRKELIRMIQQGNVNKFYKSSEWREKRKDILKRDHNECQMCKAEGKYSKGYCIHHIKIIKVNPLLALTDSNLITLCNEHHELQHPNRFNKELVERFSNVERWE